VAKDLPRLIYHRRALSNKLSLRAATGTSFFPIRVHEAGGLTIVQNPAGAEYPEMPANALANLPVTFCLNLSDIGAALELLVRRTAQFETGLAVAIRTLRARASLLTRLAEQSWRNPGTHEFLMSELALLKHDLSSIDNLVKDSLP